MIIYLGTLPASFRFYSIVIIKIFYVENFVLIQLHHVTFWEKAKLHYDLLSEIISEFGIFNHCKSLKLKCIKPETDKNQNLVMTMRQYSAIIRAV